MNYCPEDCKNKVKCALDNSISEEDNSKVCCGGYLRHKEKFEDFFYNLERTLNKFNHRSFYTTEQLSHYVLQSIEYIIGYTPKVQLGSQKDILTSITMLKIGITFPSDLIVLKEIPVDSDFC